MKVIITLCAIIAVASAVVQEVFKIPQEAINKTMPVTMRCVQEFPVDPEIIKNLGFNAIPRDETTNKFIYCFAFNNGFIDKDGHMVVDRLSRVLKDHPRVEEFKEAIKTCAKITKENPIATTLANHECYTENSPILFGYST